MGAATGWSNVRRSLARQRTRRSCLTRVGAGRSICMVDHEDPSVHTLATNFREAGAKILTLRAGLAVERLRAIAPGFVALSPGPGCLETFAGPVQGKPGLVRNLVGWMLDGLLQRFQPCGIIHFTFPYPTCHRRSARRHGPIGVVMAVEHGRLRVAAVHSTSNRFLHWRATLADG